MKVKWWPQSHVAQVHVHVFAFDEACHLLPALRTYIFRQAKVAWTKKDAKTNKRKVEEPQPSNLDNKTDKKAKKALSQALLRIVLCVCHWSVWKSVILSVGEEKEGQVS